MKYIFIIIWTSILLLSWCNSYKTQTDTTKDELFEKRKECITYKISLEKDIKKRIQEYNTDKKNYNEYIEEIFYSKKENSCFGVTDIFEQIDGTKDWKATTIGVSSKRLTNLLTNEQTYFWDLGNNFGSIENNNKTETRFYDTISKLKSISD